MYREHAGGDRRTGEAADRQGNHHGRRVQSAVEHRAGELFGRAEAFALTIMCGVIVVESLFIALS
jgi:hypothetical protein